MIKILHTADWHLGKKLPANKLLSNIHGFSRSRYNEFKKLLETIVDIAKDKDVDLVVIAGDIMDKEDTLSLQPDIQELLDKTLIELTVKLEIPVIVIGGNHDKPDYFARMKNSWTYLNTYLMIDAQYLKTLQETSILKRMKEFFGYTLTTKFNKTLAIYPIPYHIIKPLSHLSNNIEGSSMTEVIIGNTLSNLDEFLSALKKETSQLINQNVPVLLAGHFALDGFTGYNIDNELFNVNPNKLPISSYVALGHIHKPGIIAGYDNISYAGSILQVTEAEADQQKSVYIAYIDDNANLKDIETINLPHKKIRKVIIEDFSVIHNSTKLINILKDTLSRDEDLLSLQVPEKITTEVRKALTELVEEGYGIYTVKIKTYETQDYETEDNITPTKIPCMVICMLLKKYANDPIQRKAITKFKEKVEQHFNERCEC